jgi:predicted Zn-ribbon and HTH transcriptional regulator
MKEDFRCGACGHSFNISFEGREEHLQCPECRQEWKIEESRLGFFRFTMWF